MLLIANIVFWLSAMAILHSYVLFPLLLKWMARGKSLPTVGGEEILPLVTLMMSVYNEAAIIREKLDSLEQLDYPAERMLFFIGSDASDDRTNEIIASWAEGKPNVHFYPSTQRSGKVRMINHLEREVQQFHTKNPEHIYLFTDANVILERDVYRKLVRHFRDPGVALVDTRMINIGSNREDISLSESRYISREVMIKHREGLLGGVLMGPFGGCFALRSDYYEPVPDTFRVDDFFISMKAIQKGGKVLSDLEARVYESIPHDIREEYRRKRRISSGNFQNLAYFRSMLWSAPFWRAFVFFSHKVLRWLGPLIMLAGFLALSYLAIRKVWIYPVIWSLGVLGTVGIPLLDVVLSRFGIHVPLFLHIRYFVMMNIALLQGFIEYLKGIKTNVWQPPKRTSES